MLQLNMNQAQNQDEIFDVVDDNDQVIRQATRGEVHREGLLHRAVHVIVTNSAGELLMQKRSMKKDAAPGKWTSSCSGHVDSGEDYDESAMRELGEELAIFIKNKDELEFLFKQSACEETGNEFVKIYRLTYDGEVEFNKNEIDAVQWISSDEIEAWLLRDPAAIDRPFKLIFNWLSNE